MYVQKHLEIGRICVLVRMWQSCTTMFLVEYNMAFGSFWTLEIHPFFHFASCIAFSVRLTINHKSMYHILMFLLCSPIPPNKNRWGTSEHLPKSARTQEPHIICIYRNIQLVDRSRTFNLFGDSYHSDQWDSYPNYRNVWNNHPDVFGRKETGLQGSDSYTPPMEVALDGSNTKWGLNKKTPLLQKNRGVTKLSWSQLQNCFYQTLAIHPWKFSLSIPEVQRSSSFSTAANGLARGPGSFQWKTSHRISGKTS